MEQEMTLMNFAGTFLNNLMLAIGQELDKLNTIKGLAIRKKQLKALQVYIPAKYMDDSKSMSEGEYLLFLKDNAIGQSTFSSFIVKECFEPFRKDVKERFKDIYQLLSEKVYAINEKDLLEKIGGDKSDKAFRYILDCFYLTPIEYHFRSFKDTNFETLYSNDGLVLNDSKAKKMVNTFFRFFIDGDGDENAPYDPQQYYGSIPVQETRIKEYCLKNKVTQNYCDKLLSIARCSGRFNVGEKGELSLKKQYLLNIYSISVAILYEKGDALHKEKLCEQINKLHEQYPDLVDETSIESFVLRRKPILCAIGKMGEWGLRSWKTDDRDRLSVIREFVSDTYAKTQKAVPLDMIVDHLHSVGFNYERRTVQTYVKKSGCKGVGDNTYYPVDSDQTDRDRYWKKKSHILQRDAAEYLLDNGRQSCRKDIKEFIEKKHDHHLNAMTLERALFESKPSYFSKVGKGTGQKVVLSEKIKNKKDIKIAFLEPEKKELDYLVEIREGIIEYLKNNENALQKDLVKLFCEKTPSYLRERRTPVRNILMDDSIFCKKELGDKQIQITLQPQYIEKLKLEGKYPTATTAQPSQTNEPMFSWDGLKQGIIRELSSKEVDDELPKHADNLCFILRGGNNELRENSSFKPLVAQLFKYLTAETTASERKTLQEKILSLMETYYKEFYRLQFDEDLTERGQGETALRFQKEGILPDKNQGYLPKNELTIAYAVESVRKHRNWFVGHPEAFAEQTDKQTTSDIHDCLLVMLYLAKQLNVKE